MKLIIIFVICLSFCDHALGRWSRILGWASQVSSKGNEVLYIGKKGVVYGIGGLSVGNTKIANNFTTASAAIDGWHWATNQSNNTFRWNVCNQTWDLMPGNISQVNAITRQNAIGVSSGTAYLWNDKARTWQKLSKPDAYDVVRAAIGLGEERWVLTSNYNGNNIYRWIHSTNTWSMTPGQAVEIDANDHNTVIVTASDGTVWYWAGNSWVLVAGSTTKASMNSAAVYAIGYWNDLWICGGIAANCWST